MCIDANVIFLFLQSTIYLMFSSWKQPDAKECWQLITKYKVSGKNGAKMDGNDQNHKSNDNHYKEKYTM